MKNSWKYSGILLVATGILHTLLGLFRGRNELFEMAKSGFNNSIGGNAAKSSIFWFLICGLVLIIMGQFLHFYIKKNNQPAPTFIGYELLILSLIGIFIIPVSGFWLIVPQALIIIFATRK